MEDVDSTVAFSSKKDVEFSSSEENKVGPMPIPISTFEVVMRVKHDS